MLQSELCRLRARLAAQTSDEDLMNFIFNQSDMDVNYIQDLKTRLEYVFNSGSFSESADLPSHSKSEATVKGFQDSLLALEAQDLESAKCLEAEVAARTQVSELQRQLDSYRSIYGQSGDMLKQLEEKELELKKLRLQVTQHTQAETALYTELERLSIAWEALDKEVKNKMIDSAAVEDRLSKSAIEVPFRGLFLKQGTNFGSFTICRKPNPRISSTLQCEIRKPSKTSGRTSLRTWRNR